MIHSSLLKIYGFFLDFEYLINCVDIYNTIHWGINWVSNLRTDAINYVLDCSKTVWMLSIVIKKGFI